MGVTEKLGQLAGSVQQGVKDTSTSLFSLAVKVLTGLLLGLTFAMIGQEILGYGLLSFLFMMIVVTAVIVKLLRNWTIGAVLVFDLICVLIAMLLRMYVLVAP
ncbi:MAG: hypothetical protein BroJett040_10050 [Oligoflexia bacterium]|nr:MAG: hypothetical protein BroJett040_10050 [Oligoflexia bacterium]